MQKQIEKQNLELKLFCKDFKPIRTFLKEIGAKKLKTEKQIDYYFNLPQDSNSAKLKLRVVDGEYELIYYKRELSDKGPNQSDLLILNTSKDLLNILKESLGIKGIVKKTREQWQKQNSLFNLDKVKKVGKIFELEVQVENPKKDQQTFKKYQQKLLPLLGKKAQPNLELVLQAQKS